MFYFKQYIVFEASPYIVHTIAVGCYLRTCCFPFFSGDELMITELLFNGIFNDLTPQQTCALLSCFVFEEKAGESNMKLAEQLAGPLRLLQVSYTPLKQYFGSVDRNPPSVCPYFL